MIYKITQLIATSALYIIKAIRISGVFYAARFALLIDTCYMYIHILILITNKI